jgi:hypothetical protein
LFSRRTLLRRLGAGALAVPLLESITQRAHAQDAAFPTRVVFVTRGQGTLVDSLVTPGASPTDFTMGPIWASLEPFKSRIAVCNGIEDSSNVLDGNYNGHTRCLYHLWTARGMQWVVGSGGTASPSGPGGISLDQVIANHWAGTTAYDSLEFGVGAPGNLVHAGPWRRRRQGHPRGHLGWYGDQLGALLAALDAIPEGDGTLLDHTLVVYGNVFGSGSTHGHTNKTYLLAGGGAGLVGGRNLHFGGAPHGELFTALLQGLGFDDETFGDAAFCSGPLAGVLS